jgi:hypothetical protein
MRTSRSRVCRAASLALLAILAAGCGLFGQNPNPGGHCDTCGVPYPSGYTNPPDNGSPGAGGAFSFPPPRFTFPPDVTPGPDATPVPTAPDLTLFLTATASIANTADEPVGVTVSILDPSTARYVQVLDETLESGDAIDQELAPASYAVAFTRAGKVPVTCQLTVTDGNTIHLLVLNERTVVTKSDFTARSGADLDVATSPVCQAPKS